VGPISLLAIFPASRLPRYLPGELSAEDIVSEAGPGERGRQAHRHEQAGGQANADPSR
jgi:hypothetical protein